MRDLLYCINCLMKLTNQNVFSFSSLSIYLGVLGSHPHWRSSPLEQASVILYITPAEMMAFTNAASLVSEKINLEKKYIKHVVTFYCIISQIFTGTKQHELLTTVPVPVRILIYPLLWLGLMIRQICYHLLFCSDHQVILCSPLSKSWSP